MAKKKEQPLFLTLKEWVYFLEGRAATDVQIVIGAAALIAAIAAIGVGVPLVYFENLGIYERVLLYIIILIMIGLTVYYFFLSRSVLRIAPLREAIKARKLADDIISGKITELDTIKNKWVGGVCLH
jgi:type VI protein secretion system component VasK